MIVAGGGTAGGGDGCGSAGGGGCGSAGGGSGGGGGVPPAGVVTVTGVEASPRFRAESSARTVYVYVVAGATAMFVQLSAEVDPTWAPFR